MNKIQIILSISSYVGLKIYNYLYGKDKVVENSISNEGYSIDINIANNIFSNAEKGREVYDLLQYIATIDLYNGIINRNTDYFYPERSFVNGIPSLKMYKKIGIKATFNKYKDFDYNKFNHICDNISINNEILDSTNNISINNEVLDSVNNISINNEVLDSANNQVLDSVNNISINNEVLDFANNTNIIDVFYNILINSEFIFISSILVLIIVIFTTYAKFNKTN